LPAERTDNFFRHLGRAISFILGAAVFVAANFVLFMMANPSFPNPGPQPDLRLPIAGVLVVVLAIVLLLGNPGRAFGLGFGAGMLVQTLFMGWCTGHWYDPGGDALREARYARRRPIEEAAAVQRAKAKWIREVREHGLDLAKGVHRLRLAAGCVLLHRQKQGEYPPLRDSLPEAEVCYEVHRVKDDETGWRILYTRIAGKPEIRRKRSDFGPFPTPRLNCAGLSWRPIIAASSSGEIVATRRGLLWAVRCSRLPRC
jgi:hypothetical protein